MKRAETGEALATIRRRWPDDFRLRRGELDHWRFALALHDLADVLAAIDARAQAGLPAPATPDDITPGVHIVDTGRTNGAIRP